MPGSFEKKVQDKMEELKLTPSAPVWEKIETQLRPERQRRRAWLWVPFLVLLLVGAGWWFIAGNDGPNAEPTAEKQNEAQMPSRQTTDIPTTNTTADTTNTTNNTNTSPAPASQQAKPVANKTAMPLAARGKIPARTTRQGDQHLIAGEEVAISVQRKAARKVNQPTATGVSIAADNINKPVTKKAIIHTEAIAADESKETERPVNAQEEKTGNTKPLEKKTEETLSVTAMADSAVQNPIRDNQPAPAADTATLKRRIAASKKWKLALALQAGWQPTASGSTSALADYFGGPTQNNSGYPPVGSGGLSSVYARPNTIKGGAAFSVGVQLSKAIGPRLQLGFGLHYAAYRFRTYVGSYRPLDTALAFRSQAVSVGGYYRNGSLEAHTMRYGVLELPVNLSYKLTRSLPLYLSVGVSYGRMLKGNTLTFDRAANVYYNNEENLNRNLFSLSSSAQYSLLDRQNFNIKAGPMVHYQLTNFQKDRSWTPGRFFLGLKTTIQF